MRRYFAPMLVFALITLTIFVPSTALAAPPPVLSPGAVLMDGATGQVLLEQNSRTRFYPASTTKILTAIIAIERGRLDDQVIISEKAYNTEGSSGYLEPGESLTLEQLLYALMLPSGNDAAVAIAEHIGGSVEGFVGLMNQKARALGALDSNFVTPSGLHDPNHYSSPRDLALILRYALGNPIFARAATTKEYSLPGRIPRVYINHNRLLWTYPYAGAGKTGFTPEANHTLAISAERDGRRLVAALMNSDREAVYRDSAALFDFGFASFASETVLREGAELAYLELVDGASDRVPVVTAKPVNLLVARPSATGLKEAVFAREIEKRVHLPQFIKAPVSSGDKVVIVRGRLLATVDLVAGESVQALSTTERLINRASILAAKASAFPSSLGFSWWWLPVGAYALWRTGVGIRRYQRRKLRLRRLAGSGTPEYVPYHRVVHRDYGD